MVHLLKFKDSAAYSDGRKTDLTGADACALPAAHRGSRRAAGGEASELHAGSTALGSAP